MTTFTNTDFDALINNALTEFNRTDIADMFNDDALVLTDVADTTFRAPVADADERNDMFVACM